MTHQTRLDHEDKQLSSKILSNVPCFCWLPDKLEPMEMTGTAREEVTQKKKLKKSIFMEGS